jgi:Salmonella virulence plasmid 65kDa B protein
LARALGWLVSQAQAGAPMATPSTFSVTPQGAAAYQVPIQVPPGIAGVAPKLAFGYGSQGGNGIMGVGWSLSGLSSIMRCPQTIAQDGTHGTVSFAATEPVLSGRQAVKAV